MSAAVLSLFAADPEWLTSPRTPLERRFARYHAANPQVYQRLEGLALHSYMRGDRRVAVADLVEYLRKNPTLTASGDSYKLNNSFRAHYARLLVHRHPTLGTVIELRVRRERMPG